jgi:predicted DNA binding protein
MKRITCTVSYPSTLQHPLHAHVMGDGPLSRAVLLLWSPTADATTLLWCDGDRAATAAAVDAVDSVVARSFVTGDDGTYVFLRQDTYEFADALLETIAAVDVVFVPPVVFVETGDVRFEAVGDSEGLSRLCDRLGELGAVTIEQVRDFRYRQSQSLLPARQRAALDAAVDVGYYEIPRTGAIEDLATELDCATSTAGELLRKAESAVVRAHTQANDPDGLGRSGNRI